jgi:hypothetical protein
LSRRLIPGPGDRLLAEVVPRVDRATTLLAAGLLGEVDLGLAAEGAIALNEAAVRYLEAELAERRLAAPAA